MASRCRGRRGCAAAAPPSAAASAWRTRTSWPASTISPAAPPASPATAAGAGIEADHAGLHPIGRQSHDTEVIPLASACHKNRTNPRTGGRGPFDRMTPAGRRAWRTQQIARVQTWWYGRPLTAHDLPIVAACVTACVSTRYLFSVKAANQWSAA